MVCSCRRQSICRGPYNHILPNIYYGRWSYFRSIISILEVLVGISMIVFNYILSPHFPARRECPHAPVYIHSSKSSRPPLRCRTSRRWACLCPTNGRGTRGFRRCWRPATGVRQDADCACKNSIPTPKVFSVRAPRKTTARLAYCSQWCSAGRHLT